MNKDYEKIGLYPHNIRSYQKIEEALKVDDVAGIIHATGTGKTYNGLQLAHNHPEKQIVWVVPFTGIIEHIKESVEENPNLNWERDFSNIEFRTYQSFVNLSTSEMEEIPSDILILDEFHHIGAPVWGERIQTFLDTHKNLKVVGMTAYTVRDRNTAYERDMANEETDELFSGKIVSRYDLCDAMIDGVLPKPRYKSAYIKLLETEQELEKRLQKVKQLKNDGVDYDKLLHDIKNRLSEAPSMKEVLKNNIKPNGKYIYFCPITIEENVNDIDSIMKETKEWLLETGLKEEDIVFYKTTSEMGKEGKENRDAFYHDKDSRGNDARQKLKIMFAINQYNEGVHAPNIDGVIMGRATTSDIVYFEQLGRALSVKGDTHKKIESYQSYSKEQLVEQCENQGIKVEGKSKEMLIEALVSPVVIDLTNNIGFIEELENNLKDRIREIQKKNQRTNTSREIKLQNASFDIEMLNKDLYEILRYVSDRLTNTWEDKYELAKNYYEHYHDLEIPYSFKTMDGIHYDENGVRLGQWIETQRQQYKNSKLSKERQIMLEQIGMRFENKRISWEEWYELAKKYYEYHHDLEIPYSFKTNDGINDDENGVGLGRWIVNQRTQYKNSNLSKECQMMLEEIGMRFENKIITLSWEEWYELAKNYYEHYHDLEIPARFKTNDGIQEDGNGVSLGKWIRAQRTQYKNSNLSKERQMMLEEIGMGFENKVITLSWEEWYAFAKRYYEYYHNLEIPQSFKTVDGINDDENGVRLGQWIVNQRQAYKNSKLSKERQMKLEEIGMVWSVYQTSNQMKS